MHKHDAEQAAVTRRGFLRHGAAVAGGVLLTPALLARADDGGQDTKTEPNQKQDRTMKFKISLAAWSMHKAFFGGKLTQLDYPKFCREECDIDGLELVNTMFASPTYSYCQDLLKRAADHNVKILLIMCDLEGDLAHEDKQQRLQAVRNHRKWLDIAQVLGCHSIRCNAGEAKPDDEDAIKRCADSFAQLVEYARPDGTHVLIENHWGLSSAPDALVKIMKRVNDPLLGTLPDFGNFPKEVDRYDAVQKMMPYAHAVSAKCYDFDDTGAETTIDFPRMMKIVLDAGYDQWVGIEYEGTRMTEADGIRAARDLLRKLQ